MCRVFPNSQKYQKITIENAAQPVPIAMRQHTGLELQSAIYDSPGGIRHAGNNCSRKPVAPNTNN